MNTSEAKRRSNRFNAEPWRPALVAYVQWLGDQDTSTLRAWCRRLKARDQAESEAAIAEAVVWDYFTSHCDEVWLNDVAGEGGADFRFRKGDKQFVVEVTNISIAKATDDSGMPHSAPHSGAYGLMTTGIRSKVRGKLDQAKRVADLPVLVVVSTLHWNASISCMGRHAAETAMTSTPMLTANLDIRTGEPVGDFYQSTSLDRAVFLSPNLLYGPDGKAIVTAKYEPISAFVLAGMGTLPPQVNVYGGLNPSARHPFDITLLPEVPFCWFDPWPPTDGALHLTWSETEEEERQRGQAPARRQLMRNPEMRKLLLDQEADLEVRAQTEPLSKRERLIIE